MSATERRIGVVTGASSGIGAAIARACGEQGWTVALGARRLDRLTDVENAIAAAGGRAYSHALDVTDAASIDEFFTAVERDVGSPDLVVNNAGIGIPGRLHEVAIEDLRRELETDLLGPMLVTRRALPSMLERRHGDVVFVSSMNAVAPRPLQAGYTAAKAGIEGLAGVLRMELEGSGVRTIVLRLGPAFSEFGLAWGTEALIGVLEQWNKWGLMRHNAMLDPGQAAAALLAAVMAPRGVQFDVLQINPEAPVSE
jgi:NADP-dependent 3-hydroxy acid dehydrogenase YdfG